jgi:hypothetical protein
MHAQIKRYNDKLEPPDTRICEFLARVIDNELDGAESKLWHGHPVWFIDENPIVGYSKQKKGLRLMFWSGAAFKEEGLNIRGKKFKDASIFYTSHTEIDELSLRRWLGKSKEIRWDYKNIVKRKGKLQRLK